MKRWIVQLFGSLAGLLLVSGARAGDTMFDLPDTSQLVDRVALYRCRPLGFEGTVRVPGGASVECGPLLTRACAEPGNAQKGVCLRARFEYCKIDNFPTAECRATRQLVCDKTQDQWDRACDKLRYDLCKQKGFQGEIRIGTHEHSGKACAKVRREFSRPILEDEIEKMDRLVWARPHRMVGERRPAETWPQDLCNMAGGDRDHPFWAHCPGAEPPGPASVTELVSLYEEIPQGSPGEAAKKIALLQRFLGPITGEAPATDAGVQTSWDSVAATSVWLDAAESPDPELRYQALRLLARYGADDLLPSLLLTMAAGDDDERVHVTALRSVGHRTYRSGLAMAVLARDLGASSSDVRAAAFEGLAQRWNFDASGGYAEAVGKKLSGVLSCPATLSRRDIAVLTQVTRLNDLKSIEPDQQICMFGVGLDLMRLRDEVLRRYLDTAQQAETPEEQAAAVAGLRLLATKSDEERFKHLALDLSHHPAVQVRLAALTLLAGLHTGADETLDHLEAEIRDRLLTATGGVDWKHVENVFRLLFDQGKTKSFRAAGGVYDRGNAIPLAVECIQRNALATEVRTRCFELAASFPGAKDENVEAAYAAMLEETLHSGSYKDRLQVVGFLTKGTFSFLDDEINGTETLKKPVADVLAAEIERMLRAELGRDAPLLSPYIVALQRVLPSRYEELLRSLRSDERLHASITDRLRKNSPQMDLGRHLATYQPELGDLIEPTEEVRLFDPSIGRSRVYSEYRARKAFQLMVLSRYARCDFRRGNDGPITTIDAIEIDTLDTLHRYEALSLDEILACSPKRGLADIVVRETPGLEQALFQLYKAMSPTMATSAQEEFWSLKPETAEGK